MADSLYLVYLRFFENVICLICKTLTIGILATLILRVITRKLAMKSSLSPTLWVLIWCHFLNCLYSYTYHLYCVLLFRGPDTKYNLYVLFWTGVGIDVYYGLAPVALFFLTLERCFALIWTCKYHATAKRVMLVVELLVIAVCLTICVGICVVELPIDEKTAAGCMQVSCLMTKYRVYLILHMKTAFGTAGLTGSVVFWVLLKRSPAAVSVNDRVIKMTIVVELVFCIIPGFAALIWSIIVPKISLAQVLGEHATFALSIDGVITSSVFYKLLLKEKKKANNVISAWATPQSQQQT